MPQTVLFGRKFRVASDALGVPAFCSSMWRIAWSAVVLVLFLQLQDYLTDCQKHKWVDFYVLFSLVLFLFVVFIEFWIIVSSLRGNIVQTNERTIVGSLLMVHLVVGWIQAGLAVFGMVVIAAPDGFIACESIVNQNRVDLLLVLIVLSQLVDVGMKTCCCVLFHGGPADDETAWMDVRTRMRHIDSSSTVSRENSRSHLSSEVNVSLDDHPHFRSVNSANIERKWRNRCRVFFNCFKIFTKIFRLRKKNICFFSCSWGFGSFTDFS